MKGVKAVLKKKKTETYFFFGWLYKCNALTYFVPLSSRSIKKTWANLFKKNCKCTKFNMFINNCCLDDKPATQAARRPLTDATPPTGKIHPFSKMAITLEPMMLF